MLTIYMRPTCPFCAKVRDFAKEKGVAFTELNIEEEEHAKKLIELGGKRQVPYLVDDEKGVSMYESDDIVQYLSENYVNA